MSTWVSPDQLVGDMTRPIRAVVVHYENVRVERKREQRGDQTGNVLSFVVRRDDY